MCLYYDVVSSTKTSTEIQGMLRFCAIAIFEGPRLGPIIQKLVELLKLDSAIIPV